MMLETAELLAAEKRKRKDLEDFILLKEFLDLDNFLSISSKEEKVS